MRRRRAVRKRGKNGLERRPPIGASTSRGRASGERDPRPGECELRLCAGRGLSGDRLVRPAAASPVFCARTPARSRELRPRES